MRQKDSASFTSNAATFCIEWDPQRVRWPWRINVPVAAAFQPRKCSMGTDLSILPSPFTHLAHGTARPIPLVRGSALYNSAALHIATISKLISHVLPCCNEKSTRLSLNKYKSHFSRRCGASHPPPMACVPCKCELWVAILDSRRILLPVGRLVFTGPAGEMQQMTLIGSSK